MKQSLDKFRTHQENISLLKVLDNYGLIKEPYPDTMEILFKHLSIPEICKTFYNGFPVLVNPISGIIFGVALGNWPIALRLNQELVERVRNTEGYQIQLKNLDGVYADASRFGEGWIFCYTFGESFSSLGETAYQNSKLL